MCGLLLTEPLLERARAALEQRSYAAVVRALVEHIANKGDEGWDGSPAYSTKGGTLRIWSLADEWPFRLKPPTVQVPLKALVEAAFPKPAPPLTETPKRRRRMKDATA